MESAIPPHLQTARSRHRRVPDDYAPPYPSFVARHKPAVANVIMAYFGVQFRGEPTAAATGALAQIAARFAGENGPTHWDRAQYVDQAGFTNVVSVAYWDDAGRFDAWFEGAREAWTGGAAADGIGRFIEVLRPHVAHYETLFSSLDRPEGVAVLADGMSGEVQEHAYWGGMRDRIPLSQTDPMTPSGEPRVIRDGVVIADGLAIESLRRFKDDATEVREGYECGINLGSFNDLQEGDLIVTYEMREKPRA